MRRNAHVLVVCGIACAGIAANTSRAAAQQGTARQAAVRAAASKIVADVLVRDVTYLASDALKGRATPSPGLDSAAAYIVRQLKAMGVKPGGDNGTYLQHYTVTASTLDTAATTASIESGILRTETGTSGTRMQITFGRDFVVTSFLSGGDFSGDIVYVGHGVLSKKNGIDPYAGLDVRGKWILTYAGALPDIAQAALGRPGTDFTTAMAEARSRGALGVLVIPTGTAASNPGSVRRRLTARDLTPAAGIAYASYPLPQITLAESAVRILLGDQSLPPDSALGAATTKRYGASFQLEAKRFRLHLATTATTVQPYNVVGVVEGSDPKLKAEYITVSSHLDGAVGRSARNGDSIYNAADDNASGSAGNISIARALMAAPRPKRSILLIWDSGEETGLWGSRFMAYSPMSESIVAHFTVDMIGRTKAPGTNLPGEEELAGPGEVFAVGPGILSTQMESVLGRVTKDYGYIKLDRHFDDATHEFFYPRTDAAPYLERGIPYVEFFTGLHGDYHGLGDESSKLDPLKMEAVTRTVFVTLWTLADDAVTPRIDKVLPPSAAFIRLRR